MKTKLICIDIGNYNNIELYKYYDGYATYDKIDEKFQDGWYVDNMWFPLIHFISLEQWREIQIKSILEQ